jgi:outer membrane beta-barrel protein
MKSIVRAVSLLLALALPTGALAAEPEKVVVRNRLYTSDGKFEASLNAGFTVVNYLTQHQNLQLGLGYNFTEQLAVELGGGYALSSHTRVADDASKGVVLDNPIPNGIPQKVDDFEDLWRMTWSATGALRWTPIYGKLNIAAELPVHFQAYLLAGAGVGGMQRDSLVYCIGRVPDGRRSAASCLADPGPEDTVNLTPLRDTALKPLILGGAGMRFFLNRDFGLRIEVRDVAFPDSYRIGIDRVAAEGDVAASQGGGKAAKTGEPASSPGFTHLVFVQVGATFSF